MSVTKEEILLYWAGAISEPAQRARIESTIRNDGAARHHMALLEVGGDVDGVARFDQLVCALRDEVRAKAASLNTAEVTGDANLVTDDALQSLADWFHAAALSATRIAELAVEFSRDTLLKSSNGSLAFQCAVPMTAHADRSFPVMRKIEPPCIRADYATGRLTIAQWAKDVPAGVVDVFAAKRIEPGGVCGPVRVKMYGGTHDGVKYWYADISLRSLVGDFEPGNEFFYYVEPVADEGDADTMNR